MNNLYAWQQSDWRNFSYDTSPLSVCEENFLHLSGIVIGTQKALSEEQKEEIKLTFLSDEAIRTSEIEGEMLDRASVQSSIQLFFNLKSPLSKNHPRENGIAQMMVDLYRHFDAPLSDDTLFAWHRMLMNGRTDLDAIGQYRFHAEPMRIMSGRGERSQIHYEAPPSEQVPLEMERFNQWFNKSRGKMSPLIRAGIAHLYFELIHPFEDGNGRVGRALIEKSLAQSLGKPTFIAISQTMLNGRKAYYSALEDANKSNDLTDWLKYFCETIIEAQKYTIKSIEFFIHKAHFLNRYRDDLNPRQEKLIHRIFKEVPAGFEGGISVKNYITITKTSPATANRDLNDLVAKGIMTRTGERKSTRYWLKES